MLQNRFTNHILLGVKIAFLSVCLLAVFSGHHPPVLAQTQHVKVQTVPVIKTEDALQDRDIADINRHLEVTDGTVEANRKALELQGNQISAIHGEIEAFGLLLTVLSIVAIVIQIKKK
jgi:hypothetical protein